MQSAISSPRLEYEKVPNAIMVTLLTFMEPFTVYKALLHALVHLRKLQGIS